jgi:mRNA interferase RelE/StbE
VYQIIFESKAENQLKKLDKSIQDRILSSLNRIKIRPFDYDIKRLQGSPYYRLRVGEYRVILDIQQNKLIIIVVEIGSRKNIYKH